MLARRRLSTFSLVTRCRRSRYSAYVHKEYVQDALKNRSYFMTDPQVHPAAHHHTIAERMLFLHKFIRYGTRIASVAPSSPRLASELCRQIDPDRPQTI